jgi:hypothetical protein
MLCRSSIVSLAIAAAFLMALLISPASAQVVDSGKYPDLSGQWRGSVIRYDPSKQVGRGQQAPLKEPYRLMHEASMADQAAGRQGLYLSSAKCVPMGMPWQMYAFFAMDFVVTPATTVVLSEAMTAQPRRIFTDGRDWPDYQEPLLTGYSIGKWIDEDGDGKYDLLEVETRYMKVPRIFDQSGIPFHEDGQAVIKERLFLDKSDPNILHNQMTTIDNALTRPWSAERTYRRESTVIWTNTVCTEDNDIVVLGKDDYRVNQEGFLMPRQKGQKPPDLRYFNETQN